MTRTINNARRGMRVGEACIAAFQVSTVEIEANTSRKSYCNSNDHWQSYLYWRPLLIVRTSSSCEQYSLVGDTEELTFMHVTHLSSQPRHRSFLSCLE